MRQPEETRDEEKVTSAARCRRTAVSRSDNHGRSPAEAGRQESGTDSSCAGPLFETKSDHKYGSLLWNLANRPAAASPAITLPNAHTLTRKEMDKARPVVTHRYGRGPHAGEKEKPKPRPTKDV